MIIFSFTNNSSISTSDN